MPRALAVILTLLATGPAHAVSLEDYQGLSPQALRTALGNPALRWPEGETEIWRYGAGNCALLVMFTMERPNASATHFTSEMSAAEQQACLLSLVARPNMGGVGVK